MLNVSLETAFVCLFFFGSVLNCTVFTSPTVVPGIQPVNELEYSNEHVIIKSATAKAFAQVSDHRQFCPSPRSPCQIRQIAAPTSLRDRTTCPADPSIRGNEMEQRKNCKFDNAMA